MGIAAIYLLLKGVNMSVSIFASLGTPSLLFLPHLPFLMGTRPSTQRHSITHFPGLKGGHVIQV